MGKYLILDCDGVLFPADLIDPQVQKINYRASKKYYEELKSDKRILDELWDEYEFERRDKTNLSQEQQDVIRKKEKNANARIEHFDLKNQVLEEVLDEYKKRINYKIVYQIENSDYLVVNLINLISNANRFDDIYILSHVNSDEEIEAKTLFFEKFLPNVKLLFPKYHEDSYFDPETGKKREERPRTNKIEYFKKHTGIEDLSESLFIDDEESIVAEAKVAGVGVCFQKTENFAILHKKDEAKIKAKINSTSDFIIYVLSEYNELCSN